MLLQPYWVPRTGYIICRAQYEMKMKGSLVKNFEAFQDSKSKALSQEHSPSEHRALCDCAGCIPVTPTLWVPLPCCALAIPLY